tara:strand:- start:79 stop:231 length:153 start_codon:yes stop_codon:yes gene_type:complete
LVIAVYKSTTRCEVLDILKGRCDTFGRFGKCKLPDTWHIDEQPTLFDPMD